MSRGCGHGPKKSRQATPRCPTSWNAAESTRKLINQRCGRGRNRKSVTVVARFDLTWDTGATGATGRVAVNFAGAPRLPDRAVLSARVALVVRGVVVWLAAFLVVRVVAHTAVLVPMVVPGSRGHKENEFKWG